MNEKAKLSGGAQAISALIGAGVFIGICYLLGCFNHKEKKLPVNDLDKEQIVRLAKNNSSVIDAIVTDVNILYIAVLNDGVDKKPMAVYYCRLAKEKLIPLAAVKIVDYTTYESGDGWAKGKELGISYCD